MAVANVNVIIANGFTGCSIKLSRKHPLRSHRMNFLLAPDFTFYNNISRRTIIPNTKENTNLS